MTRTCRPLLLIGAAVAFGVASPAGAAVDVAVESGTGYHVVTWDALIPSPFGGGKKDEILGYDIHYGSGPPTGGDNITRLVAGAGTGSGQISWTDSGSGYSTRCVAENYWMIGYTRGRKQYTTPEAGSTADGQPLCDGGGGGGGGGSVSVATTVDVQVMDDTVTVPSCPDQVAASVPEGWTTDSPGWREEFDAGQTLQGLLSTNRWTTEQPWGAGTIVNGESQYYEPDPNADWSPFVFASENNEGYLVIRAAPYTTGETDEKGNPAPATRSDPVAKYVSGVLTTFTNSGTISPPVYVEVRAKMPRGRGAFPALWLYDKQLTGGNQELDIIEYIAQSNSDLTTPDPKTTDWIEPPLFGTATWETMYHTYHDRRGDFVQTFTNSKSGETPEWCGKKVDFTREFHTFGLLYTADEVVWSIDGIQVQRIIPRRGGTGDGVKVRNFPNASMYFIMNLAFDLSWFDKNGADCCFSDETTRDHFFNTAGNDVNLAIDYVRFYKP